MNRACFSKNANLHEQNQHASSPAMAGQAIRPLKNNFVRMKNIKHHIFALLLGLSCLTISAEKPGFSHCGFYLHEGWFFNYPFAVRTWNREDFAGMFKLLRLMGYDQVGIWPMLEAIPMPLSKNDSIALRGFRQTVDDAHEALLECWLIQCPNLIPDPSIAAKPWNQRNPYHVWRNVLLADPKEAEPYLAHRSKMISVLNNADAYVTIDGDPGGYPGAQPEDWLKVFLSDRAALDKYGIAPSRQKLIPWVWCGWGTGKVWGGNPTNPPSLIKPYTSKTMELFKSSLPEPWEILVGRSHRSDWANGRVNVEIADSLGLINRSSIFCYEAIEFEPTPPAAILQFDHIRRILREESKYIKSASGVFGNAQQPVMVLPDIYFFARGSNDPAYLDKTDNEVLKDFAAFLGGPPELLVPAWNCLNLDLEKIPSDLPQRLRAVKLMGNAAKYIPGGSERYLEILARQTDSRIRLLQSIAKPVNSDKEAIIKIYEGITALVNWWNVHKYVLDKDSDEPFNWRYVHNSQILILRKWCKENVKDRANVSKETARLLSKYNVLPEVQALQRVHELLSE